jgi:3-hydroxyisobutyrate dehydrogenase
VFVDHTTASAKLARRIGEEGRRLGLHCVDAPVSGGQVGAENGQLSIMCGGTAQAMAKAEPIIRAYSGRIVHLGPDGSGQLTKMVNQIAIAGVVQGLSEALHFAKRARLDTEKVFEAVSGGAAQSWQMENRWKTMDAGQFDFGFAVNWMRKDLGLTLDEARANGASLPVTALVDQFYAEVQAIGGARDDTSSLIRRLEECRILDRHQ